MREQREQLIVFLPTQLNEEFVYLVNARDRTKSSVVREIIQRWVWENAGKLVPDSTARPGRPRIHDPYAPKPTLAMFSDEEREALIDPDPPLEEPEPKQSMLNLLASAGKDKEL